MPTPGVGYKIGLDAPVRFIGRGGEGTEGEDDGGGDGDGGAFEPRWARDDLSREPSERANAAIEARVRESLPGLLPPPGGEPRVLHSAQVCTWTDSPDGRFIIDALAPSRGGGRVVVAAGCSGEGFKFSALMGTVLADLAEGRGGPGADEDVAALGLRRFEGLEGTLLREGGKTGRHVLGR
jgi:glycine/D-amino acid oxidase-like deaminating enzyme